MSCTASEDELLAINLIMFSVEAMATLQTDQGLASSGVVQLMTNFGGSEERLVSY